jgi:hypothetical protein
MTNYGTHKDGTPVTEAEVQAWTDEAERGYDIPALRKRGRPALGDGPSAVVPVRLDDALEAALEARAGAEQVSRSEVIREALREYLASA